MYEELYLLAVNGQQKSLGIVDLCNQNQGFVSALLTISALILSFIAIVISVLTSKSQVQAQLLERRITVYSKFKEVYSVCNRIIDNIDVKLPYYLKLRLFVGELFLYNTAEYHIAYRLTYLKPLLDTSDLNTDEDTKLIEEWSDKFFEITKYETSIRRELEELKTEIHLLFSEEIENNILELLEKYQEFRWDIYDVNETQLKRRIENLKVAFDRIDNNIIFDKMDKETTSNLFKRKTT